LDTCCYNRPFDDGIQDSVKNEIKAKQYIQQLVKDKKADLVVSYLLYEELGRIKLDFKRELIFLFIQKYATQYVPPSYKEVIIAKAVGIENTGVKKFDALHTACAIISECDCLVTVDKRLLKYQSPDIKIINPIDFVDEWRKQNGL
jgi:predicted nucleic acid-binding protein